MPSFRIRFRVLNPKLSLMSLSEPHGFISKDDFSVACQRLERQLNALSPVGMVGHFDLTDQYMVLSCKLKLTARSAANSNAHEALNFEVFEDLEPVDEAAVHGNAPESLEIEVSYHIIHSPSYQVPVLYFLVKNAPSGSQTSLDAVYEYLVPRHQQAALKGFGVLGGLGMINHPVSDVPCFWVHPCRTAEAIGDIIRGSGRNSSPEQYLMLWIGLIGSAVGLELPKGMAMPNENNLEGVL